MIEIWWKYGQWMMQSGTNTHSVPHASQALEWAFQRMKGATNFTAYMSTERHIIIVPVVDAWTPLIEDAPRNDVYHQLLPYLELMKGQ